MPMPQSAPSVVPSANVVIRKPATPGFEERPAVILQSHMDMVCEKNSDVEFDFDNDPIRAYIACPRHSR